MAAPVQLAAVDAGSNAIRLVIARATSPRHIEILENESAAVRPGPQCVHPRLLDDETIFAPREFSHIFATAWITICQFLSRGGYRGRQGGS